MKRGQDIAVEFPGLYLVHHNLPGKKVELHAHSEHLLFLPLQGEIGVHVSGRDLVCGPGRMIYLPPKTEHSFDSSMMAGERLIALIQPRAYKAASGVAAEPCVLPASALCKELLFHLLLATPAKARQAQAFVTALCLALSASLAAREETGSVQIEHLETKASDERVQRALAELRAGLGGKLSMERVARAAGMSTRNLNRLFLDELGLTPKQALSQYRVRRAQELLLGGKSVTETAFDVGYSSLSQFITLFRQVTGQLPSEYVRNPK